MKKISFFTCAFAFIAMLSSCKTQQKTAAGPELTGKWNISLIDDNSVKSEEPLFIDFAEESRVHAKVGCNIYNSSYIYDKATGALSFDENGQLTMMMCPDMATETAVLEAIRNTRKVEKSDSEDCIRLLNEAGKTLLTLCK